MGESIVLALGLLLVFEGVMPFVAPNQWRTAVSRISRLRDGQIRFMGLAAILAGLLLIAL